MILITASVEFDLLDSGRKRLLGNRLADLGSGVTIAAIRLTVIFILGTGSGQRLANRIVDDLAVNMLMTAKHGQPRLFSCSMN